MINDWLIVAPAALPAPLMSGEMVPIVQLKLLGTVAVSEYAGLVLLHVAANPVGNAGVGLTTMVIGVGDAGTSVQPLDEVAVTRYSRLPCV